MNKYLTLGILLALLYIVWTPAKAGFYLDIGGGWIHDVPMETAASVNGYIVLEHRAEVEIDSPFVQIGLGYEADGWHFEYNRFGIVDDSARSISTLRLYRRIQLD